MEALEERIGSRVAEMPGVSALAAFGSRARGEPLGGARGLDGLSKVDLRPTESSFFASRLGLVRFWQLVLDASAIGEYVLRTEAGSEVESVIDEGRPRLHVPALCDVELVSIVRRALLGARLTVERAAEAIDDYLVLPLERHGHLRHLGRIVVLRESFSAYDACYVSLAETLGATLVTGDSRLAEAVRRHLELQVVAIAA